MYLQTWFLDRFWSNTSINPQQIWIDLCNSGEPQQRAIKYGQKFLRVYATKRKRMRLSIGLAERETQRTLKSASSLMAVWRNLVIESNNTVLGQKRREDPANKQRWTLQFKDGLFNDQGSGPLYDVIRVSSHCLVVSFRYSTNSLCSGSELKLIVWAFDEINLLSRRKQQVRMLPCCFERYSGVMTIYRVTR